MDIQLIPGFSQPETIRQLFTEYTDFLMEEAPQFRSYLQLQNYDEEIAHLEYKYGPPAGRLYLALVNGEPAGCIALRPLEGRRCEMKRLYVRPAFRGYGLGRLLTERILADARAIGYGEVLLDTFPFLHQALTMYRHMGFREIGRYNDSPLEETMFLGLTL